MKIVYYAQKTRMETKRERNTKPLMENFTFQVYFKICFNSSALKIKLLSLINSKIIVE